MKKIILLFVILVGLSSVSFANTPSAELNFSSLAGCGTVSPNTVIKGTVRDKNTYAKLGGATVQLLSDTKSVCQTQTTVASGVYQGNYAFSPVYIPNSYYVRVSKTGYKTWEGLVSLPYSPPCCTNPYEVTVHVLLEPQ